MIAQVVAKGQRSLLFMPTSFDDMHVMGVRPPRRPVEERTAHIVGMRGMHVTERLQAVAVRRGRLKYLNGYLDIDDRFGTEPWNRR